MPACPHRLALLFWKRGERRGDYRGEGAAASKIGRPADGGDQIGFVVGTMSQAEQQVATAAVALAAEAVASVLTDGIERAMNRFN